MHFLEEPLSHLLEDNWTTLLQHWTFSKVMTKLLQLDPPSLTFVRSLFGCIPSFLFLRLFSQDILCPYPLFLILVYPTPYHPIQLSQKCKKESSEKMRHFSKVSASHTHTLKIKNQRLLLLKKNREHEPSSLSLPSHYYPHFLKPNYYPLNLNN